MANSMMTVSPSSLPPSVPVGQAPSGSDNIPVDVDFVVSPNAQAVAAAERQRDGFIQGPTVTEAPVAASATVSVPPPGAPPVLTNAGGAVLKAPVLVPIYYGDFWKTAQGAKDAAATDAFAQEIGPSALTDVLSEYGVGEATFGGSVQVPGAVTSAMTDADVQKVVKDALAAGSAKPNAQGLYTVFLPKGAVLQHGTHTSKQGLGGYHNSFAGTDGKPVYYAAIAYSERGNGIDFTGVPSDNVSITASHEWAEAETDPDVNSAIPGHSIAWFDRTNNSEIGDLAIKQLPLNQTFQKDAANRAVQLEWSNKDGAYEIAPKGTTSTNVAPPPPPPPTVVLPPAPNRPANSTEMEGIVTVDKYDGLQHGRNGVHEIVEGTLTQLNAVAKPGLINTNNLKIAMNVKSQTDPSGLPNEIPLTRGDKIEVEGEYISPQSPSATSQAIVHFTHDPLGYVIINGQKYA